MAITFALDDASNLHLRVIPLMLPFDNALTQADLDWIGEQLNRSAMQLAEILTNGGAA